MLINLQFFRSYLTLVWPIRAVAARALVVTDVESHHYRRAPCVPSSVALVVAAMCCSSALDGLSCNWYTTVSNAVWHPSL